MRIPLLTLLIAALLLGSLPARAGETSAEKYEAALAAMQVQRDTAANQVVELSAELTIARREIERLRKEVAAKAEPAPSEPAKP